MSLLLKSLKKADQEGQAASTEEQQAQAAPAEGQQVQAAPVEGQQAQPVPQPVEPSATPEIPETSATPPTPPAQPVAPVAPTPVATAPATASRLVTAPTSQPTPSSEAIDFDSVAEEAENTAPAVDRDLVSATRVFRAGEAEEARRSRSPLVYGILALFLCVGGVGGIVYTGVIPGVTVASMLNMLGGGAAPQLAPAQPTNTIPELATASADGAALSLPRPQIDVQDEVVVNFAGFGEEGGVLGSEEGRRAIVERIAAFASVEEEEETIDNTLLLESLEEEIRLESVSEGINVEGLVPEAVEAIKSAKSSRNTKRNLDARTPVDRLLASSIKIKKGGEVVVAQASDVDQTAQADTTEDDADAESIISSQPATSQNSEEVDVVPSLSGAERRQMLENANQFHIRGSYDRAEKIYRSLLDKNPTNVDALRGLALAAVASGRYQLGVATYLKILEYYPNDSVALADLANLHGSGENFYAIERALKNNIGKQPQWDGRLHFALGNLYAERERWLDAQKSYFAAFSGDSSNPDYAYNLAVVLDYLNKPKLAVEYYRQALELSAHTQSGFDAAPVRARIRDISQ